MVRVAATKVTSGEAGAADWVSGIIAGDEGSQRRTDGDGRINAQLSATPDDLPTIIATRSRSLPAEQARC